ncbi:PQQ-dependent sugar dehydrogenase [Hymenobacter artigasi]|uniref:Repeat protein (TIGR02543 family) n=1 Tax=Hymenobacter artigasi TaxID=2719616 RepID=A0ABX1HF24_9BACT|nr:PQQ-dependent sugar dehydrogenase [Hymenobacter artigasi]NKI88635.1 putative repeat protein (TIGR02543 family) [Hymenobacter artigasi]
MKSSLTGFLLAFLLVWCCGGVEAQTPPTGFTSTVVSSGWNEAVGLTFNSSGSKMFVWERPGKVWVVVNGQRQQLIDISPEVGAWEDQGLLGFALDPNFDANGYMYLLYVVDRHYLINFGTASYSATANDYYSATIGRLTRYTATPSGTGYTVNPASRKILIGTSKTNGIPSTFNGHVTAALQFGTDGTLLVVTGDGAHPYPDFGAWTASYAPQALADGIITAKEDVGSLRAQLVDCYNGKILRIDPSNGNGVASNPYYDAANPGAPRSKVWALGLRNPFRVSIKPGTGSTDPSVGNPGTIYLGDVGAASWEEVDVVTGPRQNFGWPLFEGLTAYDAFTTSNVYNRDAPNPLYNTGGCTKQFFYFQDLIKQATPTGTATFPNSCNTGQTVPGSIPTFVHVRPLVDWGHGAGPSRTGTFSGSTATTSNLGAAGSPVAGSQFGGSASTGGVFYPYADFPVQYRNTYFFGDYVGGWIRNLTVNSSNQPSAVGDFVPGGAVPVAFATSPGETGLFYVNFYPSEIRKISYVTTASPPVAVATSNKTYGPGPLTVQLTGSNSTDPNGSPLTYSWNFGDGTAPSAAANPSHTFSPPTAAPANYTVTLTVTNAQGLSNQASLTISANNTPPQVTITSPAAGTVYPLTGNTTYQLRATVVDNEQSGHLLSYQWQTILHHASHEHPDPVDTTRQTSTIIVPYGCGAETYYYRILLTVTDAGGLATTKEVRLDPNCNATSFTLVDADADVDIQALTNGAILNLATLPTRNLNIRANANPGTTGSVVFALSGAQTQNQTESVVPYALFSDVNGDYNPWTPPVGNYTLLATPYSGSGGSGTPGAALSISFSVTDSGTPGPFTLTTAVFGSGTITKSPNQATYANGTSVTLTATPAAGFAFTGWSGAATGTANPLSVTMNANKNITATFTATTAGQSVASYTLINADTNADIQLLTAGTTLNLATLPTRNLNVRANTNPGTVGSVVFALSGAQIQNQTETVVPYALFSDNGGVYNAWTPAVGSYSLTATPYTAASGGGTAGTPLTISFSVIDQAGTTYTLTTSTVGTGTVTRNPNAASYASGSTVSLTATPGAGFTFTGWSGDATGTANPLSVTMTANKNITATFTATTPTSYTLAVSSVGTGTVAKNPDAASYASGTSVTLTATAGAGYQFSGWSGDATGTTNPLSVTMTANKNITATFTAVSPTTYTLTTSTVGTGTVTKNPNQATYASGSTVSLTATAGTGFAFTGWSGDATGTTNPLSVTMTANKNITATFTATATYTLTVAVSGSGTVTKTPNQPSYASGSTVSLQATPAAGYKFNGWSGAATSTANPLSVTMTANKSITATFVATTTSYTLTTAVFGSGTITKSPNQSTYLSGSTVTLTATPAVGYAFTGWSGGATGTVNPLSVTMTANKSINATFTANAPQVTSLTLINADTDLDLQALTTGAVLNLATLPTPNLTIRANTSPATVGSVLFVLGGTQAVSHNENLLPYALFGDSNGDYNPWTPAIAVGSYTLTVTPYTAADNGGTAGTPLSISFTVTNQAARVAAATAATPARAGLVQTATAYPNPSADGRFFLRLPEALQGAVHYRLLTALGATLATGTLAAEAPVQRLDFTHEINAAGLYYLLLENNHAAARLKLLRQ